MYIFICEMWFSDFFPLILQILYVEIRITRTISESPLNFEITRIDCMPACDPIQTMKFAYIGIDGDFSASLHKRRL